MEITQVANTFDQQVTKNKRKKFNPKFMIKNSSDDDDREDIVEKNDVDDEIENEASKDELKSLSNNNNESPPPQSNVQNISNPFISPSKFSLLQTIGNLQQHQQQLFQQAALSAVVPQFAQHMNPGMNLGEAEAKFREFAFKTMQELLNIYGLGLSNNDIADALKQPLKSAVGK